MQKKKPWRNPWQFLCINYFYLGIYFLFALPKTWLAIVDTTVYTRIDAKLAVTESWSNLGDTSHMSKLVGLPVEKTCFKSRITFSGSIPKACGAETPGDRKM